MKKIALLLFALFLSTCTGCLQSSNYFPHTLDPSLHHTLPAHLNLHMDVEFSSAERSAIAGAVGIWDAQTSGLAVITTEYDVDSEDEENLKWHVLDRHNIVFRMTSDQPTVVVMDMHAGGEVLGWMAPPGGVHNPWGKPLLGAFVVDRMDEPRRLQTILHEFGHALGMAHGTNVQGIMYPGVIVSRTACMKKSDLTEFCAVNECGTANMYPCE